MTTKITEQNISNVANFAVDWQSVVTADGSTNTNAVAGKGYFIDTTSAAHTIVLPASPSFGDTIIINDYASTFGTNNVTINPNGNKIEADTSNGTLLTNDQTHTLVYTDSTQGWKIVNQDTASSIQPTFISATGGTVTESGDYKIHTFTGDGCFAVSTIGNPVGGPSVVDYLVIAGGGAGGGSPNGDGGGGGGAGGYRESHSTPVSGCYSASPLATPTGITVTTTTYPVTVGGGGSAPYFPVGTSGSNSIFSTITSSGGGGGGVRSNSALTGGSGGGAGGGCGVRPGAAGNTPPTSPSQGNSGGANGPATPDQDAGGGGGAGGTGGQGRPNTNPAGPGGGTGGLGVSTSITGSSVAYAGGGGGSTTNNPPSVPSTAPSVGCGGAGSTSGAATAGAANKGAGGGGGRTGDGGAGGKGIVIIRYKFQ